MAVVRNRKQSNNVIKDIAAVDRLFRDIDADKSLPTFGGFFMHCLILGVEEHVNLKQMYPKVHRKLSDLLRKHNNSILKN